jgi:enoyl-CoA hydratase
MVVADGQALDAALALAGRLAALPQTCLRSDRQSAYRQWDLSIEDALALETEVGLATLLSGEGIAGAQRFAGGAGRSGAPA